MVRGRTVLIQKDPTKGIQANNYRLIACLPIMWKLLTGIMGEKLYQHLERNGLPADEQKGCRKGLRGTKDQLLVNKAILKIDKLVNGLDRLQAYDMVPHSWILKCLETVRGAKNMITIISNSMMNWKTVLTSGGTDLGQADIRRGIFQGNSLSPLLFVLIMLPLTLVLRKMTDLQRTENFQPSTVHGWFGIVWGQQRPTRFTSTSGKDFLARHQDVVWTRQVWGPRNEKRKTGWQQWNRLAKRSAYHRSWRGRL